MPGTEPAGQTRDIRQLGSSHIGALSIQHDQRVSTQELRLRHSDQQLPGRRATVPLVDRPIPRSNRVTTSSLSANSAIAATPRGCGQRRVRRAEPDTLAPALPDRLATTYSVFTDRVFFPLEGIWASATSIPWQDGSAEPPTPAVSSLAAWFHAGDGRCVSRKVTMRAR